MCQEFGVYCYEERKHSYQTTQNERHEDTQRRQEKRRYAAQFSGYTCANTSDFALQVDGLTRSVLTVYVYRSSAQTVQLLIHHRMQSRLPRWLHDTTLQQRFDILNTPNCHAFCKIGGFLV